MVNDLFKKKMNIAVSITCSRGRAYSYDGVSSLVTQSFPHTYTTSPGTHRSATGEQKAVAFYICISFFCYLKVMRSVR